MKRTLQIVLALSLASMFLISPAVAATSQGLEWGVTVGDEPTYKFKFVDEGDVTFDEGVNVTVTSVPVIPDPITAWYELPTVLSTMVYTNGSAIGLEMIVLLGMLAFGGYFVVPIGNFSLLTELALDSPWWTDNHTMVNDGSVWGSRLTDSEDEISTVAYVHYLKSDGFLARYVVEATNTTDGVKSSVSLIRDGLGMDIIGWISDNILIVGIGVGAVVLLGAVVCVKRK
jgi:hypothetical protein